MIELNKLLQPAREIADEQARLHKRAAGEQKIIQAATEAGDFESPAVQRRCGEARIRLDMIALRLRRLEGETPKSEEALAAAYRQEVNLWNRVVSAAKAALAEERIQGELKYWEGDERACRRYWDGPRMWEAPAFYELDRSFFHVPDVVTDPIREAERLASHLNARKSYHGWTEADLAKILASAPAPRRAPKGKLPAAIRCRVRESFTAPYFASQSKNRKRPGQLEEGQEINVTPRQLKAMYKFLEPIEPLPEAVVNARMWELPQDK